MNKMIAGVAFAIALTACGGGSAGPCDDYERLQEYESFFTGYTRHKYSLDKVRGLDALSFGEAGRKVVRLYNRAASMWGNTFIQATAADERQAIARWIDADDKAFDAYMELKNHCA